MLHGWQNLTPEDRETILRGIADGEAHGGPYHIELDWVDRCNARCFFCNSADLHVGALMPWERTIELLEEARGMGLRSMRLAGGGEPTLHPRTLDLLHWMRERDIVLDLMTTNGILIDDARAQALAAMRTDVVTFSLNFCDEKTYGQGMGVAPRLFEKVCANIRRLDAARRAEGSRFGKIAVQFYIYKPTIRQIPRMYELGKSLGADYIAFRELADIDPALQYDEGDVPAIIERLEECVRDDWGVGKVECPMWSRGVGPAWHAMHARLAEELGAPHKDPPPPVDYAIRYCYIAWYSLTILGKQAVYPCCFLMTDPGSEAAGDLNGRSLHDVWYGAGFRRVRAELRRYHLLGEKPALFARRHRHLTPMCTSHTQCVLTHQLADAGFYAEADRRLQAAREQPAQRARRVPEMAARRAIDAIRGR